jgi:hypothetical protein
MVGLWSGIAQITKSKSGHNDPSIRQYWATHQSTMTRECPTITHRPQEQYYMHVGL